MRRFFPMESDMRYAIGLLEKINALSEEGRKLASGTPGDGLSWAFQQSFLLSQIKEFSKTKNYVAYNQTRVPRYGILSSFFVVGFDVLVTCVTLIEAVRLFFQTPSVITFTSDFLHPDTSLNPRLRNIHSYLRSHQISYAEILHITTVGNFFKNIYTRGRFGIYLEAFGFIARLRHAFDVMPTLEADIPLDLFDEFEKPFVRYLLREVVARMRVNTTRVRIVRAFFRFVKPGVYISADDPRYIPELLYVCEKEHIPTYVFQHSNFDYLTGLYLLSPERYVFPSVFFTWNSYWQKRVQEISPFFAFYRERIRTGGRSFTPAQPQFVNRKVLNAPKEVLSVLIPYEVSLRTDQIAPYMRLLLDDSRIRVLFVLRGTVDHIDRAVQVAKYIPPEYRANSRLTIVEPANRDKAMRECDVVAGVYSGFLDETLETGIPVCVFKTDYLNVNRLDGDMLATLIDKEAGPIFEQCMQAYLTPTDILMGRYERVTAGSVTIEETLKAIVSERIKKHV